jgi:Flp pilus assembly protein protease CpaA
MAQHRPAAVALTDGYHLAFWIAFALVIAAIVVAATILRPAPAQALAEEPVPETAEMVLAGCAD